MAQYYKYAKAMWVCLVSAVAVLLLRLKLTLMFLGIDFGSAMAAFFVFRPLLWNAFLFCFLLH